MDIKENSTRDSRKELDLEKFVMLGLINSLMDKGFHYKLKTISKKTFAEMQMQEGLLSGVSQPTQRPITQEKSTANLWEMKC